MSNKPNLDGVALSIAFNALMIIQNPAACRQSNLQKPACRSRASRSRGVNELIPQRRRRALHSHLSIGDAQIGQSDTARKELSTAIDQYRLMEMRVGLRKAEIALAKNCSNNADEPNRSSSLINREPLQLLTQSLAAQG